MIEFTLEQFLPCLLEEVQDTIKTEPLPDWEAPLYLNTDIFAYPMHRGFLLESDCGHFLVEDIDLLQSLNGKNTRQLREDGIPLNELEQYFHYGIIGYDEEPKGWINSQAIDKKYFDLYKGIETTWFCYVPQKIEIDVTKACNLNCVHCAKDASPFHEMGRLLLSDYLRLIHGAARLHVPALTLMGGEPTCNPNLIDLALEAKSLGIRTLSTSTNGWLINRGLAERLSRGFNSIQVSIHGAREETHDRIVGRVGAFEKACRAVRLLKEFNVPKLNICFTVMRDNVEEMLGMAALAKRLEVNEIRFLVLAPEGRGAALPQWDDRDKNDLSETIRGIRERYTPCVDVTAGGFPPYYEIMDDATFYGCPAARVLMYVSADGEVKPCHAVNKTVGEAPISDLLDLWHSPVMVALRRRLPCECPYNRICAGGCLGNDTWLKTFCSDERRE